jgi:hypothetical protein
LTGITWQVLSNGTNRYTISYLNPGCGTAVGMVVRLESPSGGVINGSSPDVISPTIFNAFLAPPFIMTITKNCSGGISSNPSNQYVFGRLGDYTLVRWGLCTGTGPSTVNVLHTGALDGVFPTGGIVGSGVLNGTSATYAFPTLINEGIVDVSTNVVYWSIGPCIL